MESEAGSSDGGTSFEEAFPGLISLVECDESGQIVEAEGDDAEVMGQMMLYYQQMANLIGESFGLGPLEQGRLHSKQLTAVCVPQESGTLGALFDSKAPIDDLLPAILHGEADDD